MKRTKSFVVVSVRCKQYGVRDYTTEDILFIKRDTGYSLDKLKEVINNFNIYPTTEPGISLEIKERYVYKNIKKLSKHLRLNKWVSCTLETYRFRAVWLPALVIDWGKASDPNLLRDVEMKTLFSGDEDVS